MTAFITFEGIEGSGKSTQVELLAALLRDEGHRVIATREPGGTNLGEKLRHALLDADEPISAEAEAYLMTGARAEHVRTVIRPALSAGAIVLCDRFCDSTFAYQGAGRELPVDLLRSLQQLAIGSTLPDLTLLLDLPVEEGLARRARDGATNRIDRETRAFHERVGQWFRAEAERVPNRWRVIDATAAVGVVHTHVVVEVRRLIDGDEHVGCEEDPEMKLIFAVVQGKDADALRAGLLEGGFRTTQVNSAGGFLRENNATFLVGVEDERAPDVIRIIKKTCYTRTQYVNPLLPIMEPGEFYMPNPVEVQVGGAAVFICSVSRFERIVS